MSKCIFIIKMGKLGPEMKTCQVCLDTCVESWDSPQLHLPATCTLNTYDTLSPWTRLRRCFLPSSSQHWIHIRITEELFQHTLFHTSHNVNQISKNRSQALIFLKSFLDSTVPQLEHH